MPSNESQEHNAGPLDVNSARDRTLSDFGIDPELVAAPQPFGAEPLQLNDIANVPLYVASPDGLGAGALDEGGGAEPDTAPDFEDAGTPNSAAVDGVSDAGDGAETVQPAGTVQPTDTAQPAETVHLAHAVEPDEAEQPDEPGESSETSAEASTDAESPVPLDESAPSATASAVAAVESATSKQHVRRDKRGWERTKLPKSPRARTRRAPKSRIAQQRSQRRRAVAARTVGIVTAAGTVAATVWALGWLQLPELRVTAPVEVITPEPGEQVRVCPGPLQQLGLSSQADAISSVGEPNRQVASFAPSKPTERPLAAGPSAFSVKGMNGDEHSQLGISQGLSIDSKKTNGYSVTACSQPAPSQWLLAGKTTEGQNAVLDVINPGTVSARVNFALYTESGIVRPSIPEAVIKPGERTQVSLAGLASGAESIAVRVEATGTPVVAYVHQTAIDTLTPKGSDIAGATALPATRQVISGMHVYARPVQDDDAPTDIGSVVRLLNPTEDALDAKVTFLSATGAATEMQVPLAAGRVIDMPITTLPEGDYTVVVETDKPILAAGRIAPLDGNEFAWLAASPELRGKAMVAIATGPNPKLALANPSETERILTVNGESVRVRPRSTVFMDQPSGKSIELDDADGIYAAVYYSGSGELSAMPVLSGNPDATPIEVVR